MTGSLASALTEAAGRLSLSSDTARLDAELIAAQLLGLDRSTMLLSLRDLDVPNDFSRLVARRAAGEPVQYLTGEAEFWSLPLRVTRDTLIPRPDSETLVEAARKAFADSTPPARILDLGTGSGALLAAALTVFPSAAGLGLDASVGAANVATQNMMALGLAGRADIQVIDWLAEGWRDGLGGPFDLVLCNPPYIDEKDPDLDTGVRDYEPLGALIAEEGGLHHYKVLVPQLPFILHEAGVALFEIGYRQAEPVMELARTDGLEATLHHDLARRPRAIEMRFDEKRA